VKVKHIRKKHNGCADLLSKLANTKKKSHHHSVIQQTIVISRTDKVKCFSTSETKYGWLSYNNS